MMAAYGGQQPGSAAVPGERKYTISDKKYMISPIFTHIFGPKIWGVVLL
jgi:hypothetical protein